MAKIPTKTDTELADSIIEIIGSDKAKEIYDLVAERKISFAAVNKRIVLKSIKSDIEETNQTPTEIAKSRNVSRSTVYRLFGKKIFNKNSIKK